MKYFIPTFLVFLAITNLKAQNNFQTVDLKINKDNKMIYFEYAEVQKGLLVDNYNQLVDLITKNNKVKLSEEFKKQETEFFKNNAYYFVQISTQCNQPELHNINAKLIEPNKIEINCLSVFPFPVCPGVVYFETYSLTVSKKYLSEKKIDLNVKYETIIDHATTNFETIGGNWIEGEYNFKQKIVEPLENGAKKQKINFDTNDNVLMIESGRVTPLKNWHGKYQIEDGILNIEYLDFKTTDKTEKETNKKERYIILKLTDKELLLFDLLGLNDKTSYKGYVRNDKQ